MKNLHRVIAQAFQLRFGKFEVTCPLNWISYADHARYCPLLSNVQVIDPRVQSINPNEASG